MTRHWVLVILFAAQAVLPIGGGACPCAATPAAPVHDCCCDCDPAGTDECCCYEVAKEPAQPTNATLTKIQQTVPYLFVLTEALPQPIVVSQAAVALEHAITPCGFFIGLTRAERAPPA